MPMASPLAFGFALGAFTDTFLGSRHGSSGNRSRRRCSCSCSCSGGCGCGCSRWSLSAGGPEPGATCKQQIGHQEDASGGAQRVMAVQGVVAVVQIRGTGVIIITKSSSSSRLFGQDASQRRNQLWQASKQSGILVSVAVDVEDNKV